jgi:hypothetical protein
VHGITHCRVQRLTVDPPNLIGVSSSLAELLELCTSPLHVKISDFSEFFLRDPGPKLAREGFGIPTGILAAPEVPCIGYLEFCRRDERPLMCYLTNSYNIIRKKVLHKMLLGLGRLPQKYWKRRERPEYFDEDSKFLSDSERVQGPFSPNKFVWGDQRGRGAGLWGAGEEGDQV